jgi:hypothetical protein
VVVPWGSDDLGVRPRDATTDDGLGVIPSPSTLRQRLVAIEPAPDLEHALGVAPVGFWGAPDLP